MAATATGSPKISAQALGADPAPGGLDLLRDGFAIRVGVVWSGRSLGHRPCPPLDDPAHGLVGRAAERHGGAIRAELLVRGEDVQLVPRSHHNGCPSGWWWLALTPPLCRPGGSPGGQDRSRGGDFLVAIGGDFGFWGSSQHLHIQAVRCRPADAPAPMTPLELVLFGAACYLFGLVRATVVIPGLVDRGLFPVRRHDR